MTMDPELGLTRERQGVWSKTADTLKARYEATRKWCFPLSISAALLAALASQLPDLDSHGPAGKVRLWLTIISVDPDTWRAHRATLSS